MKADLIFIGSELLTGLVENTNAGYLSRRLWACGIAVRERRAVHDDTAAIAGAVTEALRHSDAIILCGGLGPTDDDLTREAVAGLLGLPMQLHGGWLEKLERFFAERGLVMPEANRKQALVIEGSLLLDNPRGTAPGAVLEKGAQLIVMLPGPPPELQPMFEEAVLPLFRSRIKEQVSLTKTLKCTGLGESLLEEKIKSLGKWDEPALSLVARGQEVHLQLKAHGKPDAVAAQLDEAAVRLRKALEGYVFGEGEETLAGTVASGFDRLGLTLALAESCSGGLLADAVTDIPGSSRFFKGALVAYSLEAKEKLLGIERGLLEREGAVSEAVAEAMALRAGDIFAADVGAAITGVAGPDSDPGGRPVGLVYMAVARKEEVKCRRLNLLGTRRTIKERAVQAMLTMLWRMLRQHLEDSIRDKA